MKPFHAFSISMVLLVLSVAACKNQDSAANSVSQQTQTQQELIDRGAYLVAGGGCNDCHSPKVMTPQGPMVDSSRLLSGHPSGSPLPPLQPEDFKPGGWVRMSPDVTAFAGPWGVSFAANLSSDSATGVGAWTETNFIKAMRTGKHLGMEGGRPILPPMPWPGVAQFKDEDLKAIFAYLKSLPAISNRVPAPLTPAEAAVARNH